ncbi:MAG TPA: transposase [Cyclobacteriaceae bacterium]|nr:transposase [Cyclobacteriaceae bacterium]HMV89114.1 transposase [Cyclobacteriaceae bacterium]HMX02026.1 transposase [Cyclobacteriaceae bacterium]HMX49998.1 transposase [Cyclobacteriaceae bacterium]HMY93763.1 transposase [Cyclobacteriaceae bacterium]
MKKQSRRKFTAEFKARVALEAVKNEMTLAQLSQKFEVSPIMISRWKAELVDRMAMVFESKHDSVEGEDLETEKLYAQIGQLKVENDFLKKSARKLGITVPDKSSWS